MCDSVRDYCKNYKMHPSFLEFNEFNKECHQKIYQGLGKPVSRKELFKDIPNLEAMCKGCWNFYLTPRSNSIKGLDIQLGKQFENKLIEFFASIGINSKKGNEAKKNYPDNVILSSEGQIIAYYEVKYLNAPFVFVFKKVPGRECYEGSTTLDVGVKIESQREIVENIIDVPVFYLYWLDYPCIKGIFYMNAKDVYHYIDEVKMEWDRKSRLGNFVKEGEEMRKVGHTKKVYLPLLRMKSFEEFLGQVKALG